jgi:hypothetical protein
VSREPIKLRTSQKDADHFQDCPQDYNYNPGQFNPFQYCGPYDIAHDLRLLHTRKAEFEAALSKAAKWDAVAGLLREFRVISESWMAGSFLLNEDGSYRVNEKGHPVSGASLLPDVIRNLSAALARTEGDEEPHGLPDNVNEDNWRKDR